VLRDENRRYNFEPDRPRLHDFYAAILILCAELMSKRVVLAPYRTRRRIYGSRLLRADRRTFSTTRWAYGRLRPADAAELIVKAIAVIGAVVALFLLGYLLYTFVLKRRISQ